MLFAERRPTHETQIAMCDGREANLVLAVYERIREILESARTTVARSVNTTQVVANWLIGREIVEEEQRGKKRADYGTELLPICPVTTPCRPSTAPDTRSESIASSG